MPDQKKWVKLPKLDVTFYPPEHAITQRLIRKCIPPPYTKRHTGPGQCVYAMEAHIKNAKIMVLLDPCPWGRYEGLDETRSLLLKAGLKNLLKKQAKFYVYRNTVYWWHSAGGKALAEALTRGIAPEICALLETGRPDDESPGP